MSRLDTLFIVIIGVVVAFFIGRYWVLKSECEQAGGVYAARIEMCFRKDVLQPTNIKPVGVIL